MIYMAGSSRILLSGFENQIRIWLISVLVCTVTMGAVWCLVYSKWKNWCFLIITGALVIVFITSMPRLKNGICVLANKWLDFLTGITGRIYLKFSTDGQTGVYAVCVIVLAYISALLMLTMIQCQLWLATVLFGICLSGCACGFMKADAMIFVLIVGYIVLVFLQKMQNGILNRKGLMIMSVVALLGVGLFLSGVTGTLIYANLPMEKVKLQTLSLLHEKYYDHGDAVLSEGNLINLGIFSGDDTTALEIIVEEQPDKLYLRGMTADIYTGHAWKSLSQEAYREGSDLFYWLHKENYYAQYAIAKVMTLSDSSKRSQSLEIKNISACSKYRFLPYALMEDNAMDEMQIGDERNLSEGMTETLKMQSGSVPQWYQAALWLVANQEEPAVSDYLSKEASYRKFVYANDLQLTDTAVNICEQIMGKKGKDDVYTLPEILELIRTILDEQLEYRTDVVTYNGENDFFQYTMEQSKSGYSVQYATAATLLLRYFGVPSRYVEGYYVSPEEAENVHPGETFSITKSQAHAWAEYYLDGVGWIPFEVTPGYVDEDENQQVTQLLANGNTENEGALYKQDSLTYMPPSYQKEHETAPDQRSHFSFRVHYALIIVLLFIAVMCFVSLFCVLGRRRKLMHFLKDVQTGDRREAVTGLYAYSQMLIIRCQLLPGEQEERVRQINSEARFSCHEVTESALQEMMQYTDEIVKKAKNRKDLQKRFIEHYLLWLYK